MLVNLLSFEVVEIVKLDVVELVIAEFVVVELVVELVVVECLVLLNNCCLTTITIISERIEPDYKT